MIEFLSRLVDRRGIFEELGLQFTLCCLHIDDHRRVASVGQIGNLIKHPESCVIRPSHHVAVADREGVWNACDRTVHGSEDGALRIVDAEPQQGADRIRQPRARLRNEDEPGLLRCHRSLMEILLAVDRPGQWSPAIGHRVRSGADVLGHIERRAFVGVTHEGKHVVDGDFAVGLDPQRHTVS